MRRVHLYGIETLEPYLREIARGWSNLGISDIQLIYDRHVHPITKETRVAAQVVDDVLRVEGDINPQDIYAIRPVH